MANPGKLIFRNFNFRSMDRFLENSSVNFLWVPIQFLSNMGAWLMPHELDLFLENSSGSVFQKSVCVTPGILWISSPKCFLDDFSKNPPVSCPKIIKLTFGWVFQKLVLPCPGKLPIRVKEEDNFHHFRPVQKPLVKMSRKWHG